MGSTVVVGDPFGNHGDVIDLNALVCFILNNCLLSARLELSGWTKVYNCMWLAEGCSS